LMAGPLHLLDIFCDAPRSLVPAEPLRQRSGATERKLRRPTLTVAFAEEETEGENLHLRPAVATSVLDGRWRGRVTDSQEM